MRTITFLVKLINYIKPQGLEDYKKMKNYLIDYAALIQITLILTQKKWNSHFIKM